MIYQLLNKKTEILLLPSVTSHITHLRNQFNHSIALLILMPRFEAINFHQNRPSAFVQKNIKFSITGGSAPDFLKQVLHCRFLGTCLCRNNALCFAVPFILR